jgi:outer membrane lipoprotein SlyB
MLQHSRIASLAFAAVAAAALTACGTADPYGPNNYPVSQAPAASTYPSSAPMNVEYGRVTNIQVVQSASPPRSGTVGTVIGGVAGGALGSQVGGGTGRIAATVLGAVGGAILGNRIDKGRDNDANAMHRITLQTDQGAWRTYDVGPTDLSIGERVRVENGQIYRA